MVDFWQRKLALKTFIMALAIMLVTACGKRDRDTTNLVGNSWLGYQPFYLQHHLHREQQPSDISVTMLMSDVSVIRMLTNEAAGAAMLSLDNAIALQSLTALDLCVALVMSHSVGADAILLHPNFVSYLDSEEPIRVGMEDSALSRYMLSRWLEHTQIDPRRIERRIVLPNTHLDEFARGNFDVVVAYAPFAQRLEQLGATAIFTSLDIPNEIVDIVVVRQQVWQRERDKLLALVTRSWDQALAALQTQELQTMKYLEILTELDGQQLQTVMGLVQFYTADESRVALVSDYPQWFATVAENLVKAGVQQVTRDLPVCDGVL
ncbi:MAG: ABC transporter substrate-binding protein [Aliidiomarina sp.]|uniref:ABC transporter substrate-binding protein n=1 Tax=Aliidiomarina sp. TaxID=1872439 RepID=UPI0025C00BAC|nr:ABC transporter substrate-binding protein [Aliidiomarina sp.]MCH8500885.1 ABC transporter substrate-binding protein [Aliidiomarina sp.]